MDPAKDTLDFATYAEVKAHLRHFPEEKRAEVVLRLGHDPAVWDRSSAKWSKLRDEELARGETDLTTRFGSIFTRTQKRLLLQRPTLESLGPLPEPKQPAPAEAQAKPDPTPEAEPPPIAPPEVQLSTAQRGGAKPNRPSFLVTELGKPSPLVPPAVAPPPPPAERISPTLGSTVPMSAESPLAKLPFVKDTTDPSKALSNAFAHAQVVQGPASSPRSMGGTVGISNPPPPSGALPFPVPLAAGCPDLTVVQYASLKIELLLHRDRADAVLARYGGAPGSREALEAHWRARMETDPLLRAEFARAYATYLSWLREHQRQA
jgi:hypothetical protein